MKRLVINVSGATFETTDRCLERYPHTLLGDPQERTQYFVPSQGVYFFNRHRLAFEGILMYYQRFGRVVCPENVPEEVFLDELEFFKIDCAFLQDAQEAKKFVLSPSKRESTPKSRQGRIWNVLQNPESSCGAQILSTISLVMTLISIILTCLHPGDKHNKTSVVHRDTFPIEIVCFSWFTLEYSLRLWACPQKRQFVRSWIDLTDLITLVIFFSSLALSSAQASTTSVLKVFRLANAFRVFRLTRFSNGLRLLIYTIYKSRTDLQILVSFLAFFIVISGSIIYFAEAHANNSQFRDGGIFDGMWFSLISCTTVGYGDIVPASLLGKFATAMTITFGAMFIMLPVLKLVNSFSDALEATRSLLSCSEETQVKKPKENSTIWRKRKHLIRRTFCRTKMTTLPEDDEYKDNKNYTVSTF